MAKQFIKSRFWRIVYWGAFWLFAAVFLFSGVMIAFYYYDGHKSEDQYQELASIVEKPSPSQESVQQPPPLEIYAPILEQNKDFIGWVAIQGTRVNYPVMQKMDSKNYYLRRGFDGTYSYYGVPYASENATYEEADNFVIYGHHMDNGTMFSDLIKYVSKGFYQKHKYIQFDTIHSYGKYEVIAVLKTTAGAENEFKYHEFAKAKSENEFNDFIKECKRRSLYEIKTTAEYGDKLITLSTCEYSVENGRLAVIAKKIS